MFSPHQEFLHTQNVTRTDWQMARREEQGLQGNQLWQSDPTLTLGCPPRRVSLPLLLYFAQCTLRDLAFSIKGHTVNTLQELMVTTQNY